MLGGGGRKAWSLACTAGPKSALAVEYLLQFGVDAVAVAGGLKGWDAGGLELVDAFAEDEDDEDGTRTMAWWLPMSERLWTLEVSSSWGLDSVPVQ